MMHLNEEKVSVKTKKNLVNLLTNKGFDFVIVPQAGPQEFITSFRYDSWGRILDMTYPDSEVVTYGYNQTGDLITMEGERSGFMPHDILNSALYDGYGNMSSYEYGNQAKTNLTYHNKTRRLTNSEVQLSINGTSQTMLDKSFQYNDIGNIEEITNNAIPITTASGAPIGGAYKLEGISYNHLGQLEEARLKYGSTSSGLGSLSIDQTISTNFFSAGRLASKTTIDNISGAAAISDLDYSYNPSKRHQITAVSDQINNITKDHNYTYNAMGSVTEETYTEVDAGKTTVSQKTSYCWTEDQKLAGVLIEDLQTENSTAHHYLYDHTGNRIMKSNIYSGLVNVNSSSTLSLPMDPPTVYVNAYFIATHYLETVLASKHYYMGAQRIATNLISYPFDHDNPDLELIQAPNEEDIGYTAISTGAPQDLMATLDCLYGESQTYTTDFLYLQSIGEPILMEGCPEEVDPTCLCEMSTYFANFTPRVNCDEIEIIYFYHPDYLGSVEFITDMRGEPYQFFLNTPWGENLENQYAKSYSSFSSRFRFNGKEWDEETGNYYYGARYYDPKVSVWLSVDPLASKYPYFSPYNFVENNPIMLVDPDGREVRISGSEKKSAYKQLRKALKREGIKLSREKTASGYVLNYSEKSKGANYSQGVSTLLLAMTDDNIDLDIHAVESAIIDYDKEANYVNASNGGSFMGSNYSAGDDCATTTQLVVPEMLKTMENLASVANGSSMLHEATEGAIASYQALNGQSSVPSNGSGYKQADASAFPQPFDEVSSFLMSDNRVILNNDVQSANRMIWSMEIPNGHGGTQVVDFWIENFGN